MHKLSRSTLQLIRLLPFLQIDYLSSLPPELLIIIFDFAHDPASPLPRPLSKTLFPYFRRNFYSHVRLNSASSLAKFLSTIEEDSTIGPLINELDAGSTSTESSETRNDFLEVLRLLPALRSAETPKLSSLCRTVNEDNKHYFVKLVSLQYYCSDISPADLVILSEFTNLKHLGFSFKTVNAEAAQYGSGPIESVESLTISLCEGQWNSSLAFFVDHFKNLKSLTLWDYSPDFHDFLLHLQLAPSLLSLALTSGPLSMGYSADSCDHLLPRFRNLEHVELGYQTLSFSLPTYLRQLPNLKSLRLGPETCFHFPNLGDLPPLIQGPDRLPNFKSLTRCN